MDGNCHERRDGNIERARRIVRRRVPEGVSLVDELIRERREEAAREGREFAALRPSGAGWRSSRGGRMARSSRLGLRLTPAEKQIIDRAATLGGMSTADFVRTTMLAASERVVRVHRVLVLTNEGAEAFVEAITNPPEPNENLRRLARESKLARPPQGRGR